MLEDVYGGKEYFVVQQNLTPPPPHPLPYQTRASSSWDDVILCHVMIAVLTCPELH